VDGTRDGGQRTTGSVAAVRSAAWWPATRDRRRPGRRQGNRGRRDGGTAIPLILLCFLLAGTFVCGSIAASAAFLAQRDLAGLCDGAAVAAANAFSRTGDGAAEAATDRESRRDSPDSLPLDPESVQRAVSAYLVNVAATGAGDVSMAVDTDGRVATVTCRRRVHIPFGGLLGHRDGLDRTAVARARSPLD
jgi:Putative Flp pilus-assembly TadE/G-like